MYLDYNKEEARIFLEKEYNWKYYGGHHLENRMTAFYHSYYLPKKFNTDLRNNTLSARVRNNKINREDAWKEYNTQPTMEDGLIDYFKKRLEIPDNEFDKIINEKPKSWYEYPTYKILRPNLVQWFLKYFPYKIIR